MEEVRQIAGRNGFVPVWRLAPGEKVSVDGVYDMPMPVYHGDCCVGPSISSTGLRTIVLRSPLHYWDESYLNPNRVETDVEDAEKKAFRMGRAAHGLMLEPHLFKSQFVTRPSTWADWKTQAARRWRADAQLSGLTVLDPAEMQQIHGMAQAMKAHPLYDAGILDGDIELAIIWRDPKTGIWLKARPDVIPRGTNMFADIKTTNDASTSAIEKKFFRLGYDMQMALGGRGMLHVLGRVVDEYVLVAIESARPFAIRIAPIALDEIARALSLLRHGVNKFAACLEANSWPSFEDDDNEYIYRNSYQAKLIDAQRQAGILPREF